MGIARTTPALGTSLFKVTRLSLLSMRREVGVLFLSATLLAALLPTLDAGADANPPVFVDTWWEPHRPIHPSNVTLYANVTDPDGVAWVQSTFCYYTAEAAWICVYSDLADPDGDGVWTVVPEGPYGTSTQAEPIIGAKLGFTAGDTALNYANTTKVWILFVDSVNVTLVPPVLGAEPGQAVAVNGTAFYESNLTAPAEGVSVTVSVPGSSVQATVDATGTFSANLTAPATEGVYAINATATDRTLTGWQNGTLAVSTVPRPDLRVENVRPSSTSPTAGQPFTLTFDVTNVGTEDAVGTRVVVETSRGTAWAPVYDEQVDLAKGGGTLTLAAEWAPAEGATSVRIRVDADEAFAELDEGNNNYTTTITARAQDLPVLWIAAGGGIASVAVVGGVLALRRRRSRPIGSPAEKGKGL
jgi:hypothetical protein